MTGKRTSKGAKDLEAPKSRGIESNGGPCYVKGPLSSLQLCTTNFLTLPEKAEAPLYATGPIDCAVAWLS